MYFSLYEMIVDCKAAVGTQGYRQSDGGVRGGFSCYFSIQVLLICIQWKTVSLMDKEFLPNDTVAICLKMCELICISHDMT